MPTPPPALPSASGCSTCRAPVWDDYNKALIGKGGGIFARSLKEIPLSPEVKALIGSDAETMTPPGLINALLKAEADLLMVRRHRHLHQGLVAVPSGGGRPRQ